MAPLFERAYPALVLLLATITIITHVPSDPPSKPAPRFIVVLFLALVLYPLLQCTPFPTSWVGALSNAVATLKVEAFNDLRLPLPATTTLSLIPRLTLRAFDELLSAAFIFVTCLVVLRRPETRNRLAETFCVISAVIALFGVLHRLSGSTRMFWILDRGWTFFGPYVNANHAGALFAVAGVMTLVLSVRKKSLGRLVWAGLLSAIVLGLMFTGSRSAILSFGAGAAVAYVATGARGRKASWIGILSLSVVMIVAVAWQAPLIGRLLSSRDRIATGLEFRPQIWQAAQGIWKSSPWFGTGLGTFGNLSPLHFPTTAWLHPEHAENDYLELLACGGAIAALLGALLLGILSRRLFAALRDPEESITRKSFGAATIALLVNALFVFHAPLPAHQILFAFLTAGFLATRQFSPLDSLPIRRVWIAILLVGVIRFFAAETTHPPSITEVTLSAAPSPTEVEVSNLLNEDQAIAALQEDPLNGKAWYQLSRASARMGDRDAAVRFGRRAQSLEPFALADRVNLIRDVLPIAPVEGAMSANDLLKSAALISPLIRAQIHLDLALSSFMTGDRDRVDENLKPAAAYFPEDWRVIMLTSMIGRSFDPALRQSWKKARENGLSAENWDHALFTLLPKALDPEQALSCVRFIAHFRNDIGPFLVRAKALLSPAPLSLAIRIDDTVRSPRFIANNSTTAENARWITPPGILPEAEVIDVKPKRAQVDIDAYLLPVDLILEPDHLSFRISMVVSPPRRQIPRVVLDVGGRFVVSPDPPIPAGAGRFFLTFLNAGAYVAKLPGETKVRIRGVGFTPLEKPGRYEIGSVEVFVDSPR